MMPIDSGVSDDVRAAEAVKIYRAIFRRDPPEIIVERFTRASDRLNKKSDEEELKRYYRALRVSDLEALEVACRYTRTLPLLNSKFRLMVYLAETLPENQRFFIKERKSILGVLWALKIGALRTGYKLVIGLFLLVRVRYA